MSSSSSSSSHLSKEKENITFERDARYMPLASGSTCLYHPKDKYYAKIASEIPEIDWYAEPQAMPLFNTNRADWLSVSFLFDTNTSISCIAQKVKSHIALIVMRSMRGWIEVSSEHKRLEVHVVGIAGSIACSN